MPLMKDFPLLTKPSLYLLYLQCPPVYLFCTWTTSVMSGQTKGVHLGHPSDLISPQPLQSLHLRPSNMTQTVNKPCNTVKLCTITRPYTVCLPSLMSVKFALLTLWKLLSSFTLFWWTRHLFLISVTLVHLTLPTLSWVAIKGHQ